MAFIHHIPNLVQQSGRLVRLAGQRFCEGCQTYRPAGKAAHVKGWRCRHCQSPQTKERH